MVPQERHVLVLRAIAEAFVDLASPEAVEVLRPLVRYPDSSVRLSATHGIMTSYKAALPELLQLSRDTEAEVRNWATFAIGSQLGVKDDADSFVDAPELRQALAERLTDADEETRAEAALGLALRGDASAIPVIEQELARDSRWSHYLEAAAALPDARFLLKRGQNALHRVEPEAQHGHQLRRPGLFEQANGHEDHRPIRSAEELWRAREHHQYSW